MICAHKSSKEGAWLEKRAHLFLLSGLRLPLAVHIRDIIEGGTALLAP